MSKEEILYKNIESKPRNTGRTIYDEKGYMVNKDVEEAMDIYAKEVAIEFAELAAKNGWYFNKIQRWSNRSDKSEELLLVLANTKSTEQLYELFLKSKQ